MLKRPTFRPRNILYLLTGLCVLSFQLWWLRDGYNLRRKALLDSVVGQTQQFQNILVVQRLAPTLSIHGDDTSSIDLSDMLGRARFSSSDTMKLRDAQRQIREGAGSISLNLRTHIDWEEQHIDSMAYRALLAVNAERFDSADIEVFYQNGQLHSSFPRGASRPADNVTAWLENGSAQLGSLSVHINGIFWKILPGLIPALLFSAFYLCLFVWTMLTLLRSMRENKLLLESKTAFTQNMTHELKIPISGLFLATEALERFNEIDDRNKARQHIETMRKGLQQLSALVDRILNSARLQQRQVRLNRSVIVLRPLLEQICKELGPWIQERHASIDLAEVSAGATIFADPEQLRYVFFNLIDNAIKYTPGAARVAISLRAEGAEYFIEVQDEGIGISPDYQQRIFEPYFRVPQQDRHDVTGYGLGLNIVQEIIALHSGSVRVSESGSSGTTFQIRLPRHDV